MRKLILASLTISSSLAAQSSPATRPRTAALRGSLEHRLAQLVDAPPFDRATWGIYVVDDRGRVLYRRNADHFSVPASNTKLVVTAAAAVPLPADYRGTPRRYANRPREAGVGAPAVITWSPDLSLVTLENRARTVPADSSSTIGDNFFKSGGGWSIRAEGTVALGRKPWVESVAVPDPNLYAARALATSLGRKGVAVTGGAVGTTDSLAYRAARCCGSPLVEYRGRPLPDVIFPILNTSQNWFAEMLLKVLGREVKGEGSWTAGLDVERRFLTDSVKIDSTAFALEDGSGLAAGNLVTPHAFAQLLAYMHRHPKGAAFVAALPHAGQPGSLLKRFAGTPLEGRVIAKTGSIDRVNSLSGYIEQPNGRTVTFSVQANGHAVPYQQMLNQIDSVVVQIGR